MAPGGGGIWGPGWGGKVDPGGRDFGPQVGRNSGPRFSGFSVHAGEILGSTVTGIIGPMWALLGVQGWEKLEYQEIRRIWFQVGGMCRPKLAGFSVEARRIAGLVTCFLCSPCEPPYGHGLFSYSVRYGGRGGSQGCSRSQRMMTGVYVGPKCDRATTFRVHTPFRPPSFGRGASGSTRKQWQTARPRCS